MRKDRLGCLLVSLLALSTGAAQAGPISGRGTWETTLLGRDASGNAVPAASVDALFLYDTSLDITWLKNANLNGPMTWWDATSWAQTLQVGKFRGWRLPSTADPDPFCGWSNGAPAIYSQGYWVGCAGSEMGHLFNVTLGNAPDLPVSNTGHFLNIQLYYYWSGTLFAPNSYYAWTYQTGINGQQFTGTGTNREFAMAVRDGDVLTPVPEPGTDALMGIGLMATGLVGLLMKLSRSNF